MRIRLAVLALLSTLAASPAAVAQDDESTVWLVAEVQDDGSVLFRYGTAAGSAVEGALNLTVRHERDPAGAFRHLHLEENSALQPGEEYELLWAAPKESPSGAYSAVLTVGGDSQATLFALGLSAAPQRGASAGAGGGAAPPASTTSVVGEPTWSKQGDLYQGRHLDFHYSNGTSNGFHRKGDVLLAGLDLRPAPDGEPMIAGNVFHQPGALSMFSVEDSPQALTAITLQVDSVVTLRAADGSAWKAVSPRTFVLAGEPAATATLLDAGDDLRNGTAARTGSDGGGSPATAAISGPALTLTALRPLTVSLVWSSADADSLALAEHLSTGFLSRRILANESSAVSFASLPGGPNPAPWFDGATLVIELPASSRPHGLVAVYVAPDLADPALGESVRVSGEGVRQVDSLEALEQAYGNGERAAWTRVLEGRLELVYAEPASSASQVRLVAFGPPEPSNGPNALVVAVATGILLAVAAGFALAWHRRG